MNELGTVFALSAWPFCDFLELSVHRAGTESADAHAGSAKFGPERLGEAGDVRFGCGVNREGLGIGRKPAEELTFKMPPRFRAIICGSKWRVRDVRATMFTSIICSLRMGSLVAKGP